MSPCNLAEQPKRPEPLEENLRKTGIDVIGAVPWGTHLCQFYETKQDLLDILLPYFKAGLENNEFCMWVTSEPLSEEEAKKAMIKAMPNFAQYLERGQIEIVPYTQWYLKDGAFNLQRVLNAWTDKLNKALAKGYDGMRVTGNTAWVEEKDWRDFVNYEEEVDKVIGRYNMLTLCTYLLSKCGASEIIDVMGNHQFVLIKRAGDWVLESSEYKQPQHNLDERKRAEEVLRESEKKYNALYNSMLNGFAYCKILVDENNKPIDFVHLEVNKAWERSIGLKKEDIIGKKITEVIPGIKESKTDLISIYGKVALTGEATEFELYFEPLGKWFTISVYSPQKGYFVAVFENITERKQAEEALWESNEKYRRLFQSSPVGITTLDLKGVITSCNPAVYDEGGYSEDELVGKHFSQISPLRVKDIPKFIRVFSSILRGKVPEPFEIAYNHKDGTTGWTEIHVSLLKEGSKKLGIQVLQRDITELKQAEEALKITLRATPEKLTLLEERFFKYGLKSFSDSEMIELFLSHALSHKDCEKLVREVVKRYKTLSDFLTAPVEELEQIPRITPHTLICIKLMLEMPPEYLKERIIDKHIRSSSREVFDYLYASIRGLKKEVFKVIYLNSQNQIIDTEDLFEGTLDGIHIYPRDIEEGAIKHKATGLIFVHNHPSGDCTPSRNDKQITRDLVFIGKVLQIKVLDHIIIGGDKYFSLADAGLIEKYEDEFLNLRLRKRLVLAERITKYSFVPQSS